MKNMYQLLRPYLLLTFALVFFSISVDGQSGCILDIPVNLNSDDAEESGDGNGNVSLNSSDLEMVFDGDRANQTVGIRMNDLQIPNGAIINHAYIQFTAERVNANQTVLTIYGESADNAPTFSEDDFNISTRSKTSASASWSPPGWSTIGEAGVDQRTSDLTSIVTEIVSRPGWSSGNSIVFILSGSGKRVAFAFDNDANKAPVLHIEYECPDDPTPCDDNDPSTVDVIDINGNCLHIQTCCDDGDPQTRDYFDENGQCVSEPIVCDDGDEETTDYLDENGVCHHVKTEVGSCDECPDDPDKTEPGECGCGNPDPGTPCDDGNDKTINDKINSDCQCEGELDTDQDGTPDDQDGCPTDADKTEPGECGCGNPDTDNDGDGIIDCIVDQCPNDPDKTEPGECGCGNPETDTDGDGTPDCNDWCPNDPNKTEDGQCGCGNPDKDTDGDGTPDCNDWCPNDPNKTEDGQCGCGNPEPGTSCDDGSDLTINDKINSNCQCEGELDTDRDGTPDDQDACPNDPDKTTPGECGCGNPDTDNDGDGVIDCVVDQCPNDPDKTEPGECGCGNPDTDTDEDGTPDCNDPCPEDPNDFCEECPADLEDCDSYINFISCDKVVVCLGKDISNIVVDLGPTGFQGYDVDTKFDGLSGKRWEYIAPEGETINGVWVKTAAFCGKCTDDEELYGCVGCEGTACPQGNGSGPYYSNNLCECSDEEEPVDTDEDGVPDCEDPCPEDPEDVCDDNNASSCSDLEGCENEVSFPSCDKVVVCTGEKINQIVVDMGPTGFQHFSVDPKFTGIHSNHWEFTAPEGKTIHGVWVKTKGYCDKCGDDDAFSCVDCEGDPCPRGNGGGRYYTNEEESCPDNAIISNRQPVDLNLYPNPTTRQLFIKIKNKHRRAGQIHILNTNGDRIHNQNMDEWNQENLSIDLGNAPHGLYFLRIIFEDGTVATRQFVLTQ